MNDAVASGAYIIAHPSVEFIYRFYIKWRFIWQVWKPRIFTEYFDNNLKLNTYKDPGAYASGFLYVVKNLPTDTEHSIVPDAAEYDSITEYV